MTGYRYLSFLTFQTSSNASENDGLAYCQEINATRHNKRSSSPTPKLDKMGQPCIKDPQHPTTNQEEGCPLTV
ncbi:MAG: hypothetical protein KME38_25205 [Spirirestis rafaelensis WJT71-NPBG6]|jgi:hypothetical protein|nr:hypothetical protein [Spirirestis rafaelensis WJT71-NPBG6]